MEEKLYGHLGRIFSLRYNFLYTSQILSRRYIFSYSGTLMTLNVDRKVVPRVAEVAFGNIRTCEKIQCHCRVRSRWYRGYLRTTDEGSIFNPSQEKEVSFLQKFHGPKGPFALLILLKTLRYCLGSSSCSRKCASHSFTLWDVLDTAVRPHTSKTNANWYDTNPLCRFL